MQITGSSTVEHIEVDGDCYERTGRGTWTICRGESMEPVYAPEELERKYQGRKRSISARLEGSTVSEKPENSQKLLTIYVAGPMRGHKYFNFPAFDDAKAELESRGFVVISPADLDRDSGFDPELLGSDYDWTDLTKCDFSLRDAIDRDVAALKTCDAIYMLRGWESSKGANAEKALAEWMGLEVMYQDDADILEEALRITKGDRNASYGPPDQDFQRTAQMWSAIKGVPFEAREVAMFMVALKLSRETHQRKRDNWVDIAGYARCGSLCK